MLQVDDGHCVRVDEIRIAQEISVHAIQVQIQPVIILEIAVIILCHRASSVFRGIMQILIRVEHSNFNMHRLCNIKLEILRK